MSTPTHVRTDALTVGAAVVQDGQVLTVTHVQPIPGTGTPGRHLVVFASGIVDDQHADHAWILATPEQAAKAAAAARSTATARLLEDLASTIRAQTLPAPRYSMRVGLVVDSIADLGRWAQALGGQVERGGTNDEIPVIHVDDVHTAAGIGLDVHVQAQEEWPC